MGDGSGWSLQKRSLGAGSRGLRPCAPLHCRAVARLLLLHKPFRVMCQFTDRAGRDTLARHVDVPGVYPAGRLDYDSEGLLALTDDGVLQARIADPRHALEKTYVVQVEGEIDERALERLRRGVVLKDGRTRPSRARRIAEPDLAPRVPPIRVRAAIPTRWIELAISEGRNRQVRRMTAAVGFPTLRLVRVAVGPWALDGLAPGEWRDGDPRALERAPARRASRPVARRGARTR